MISRRFHCGYCNTMIASKRGWNCFDSSRGIRGEIRICPHCNYPTFFEGSHQIPGVSSGESIDHVPESVNKLYEEARLSTAAGAFTAAVLALRKLLMNIAVDRGASKNLSFQNYVDYLAEKHYVPPNGKEWVDIIRNKGNDATHEIIIMTQSDAEQLISFAGMLLKFIYEFPTKARPTVHKPA